MKTFTEYLNEVIEPSQHIPFTYSTDLNGYTPHTMKSPPSVVSIGHEYVSKIKRPDGSEDIVSTNIFHNTGANKAYVEFKVNNSYTRNDYRPNVDHTLKIYNTVLTHLKHFTDNNEGIESLNYSIPHEQDSSPDRTSDIIAQKKTKRDLYARLGKKFGIRTVEIPHGSL